VRASRLEGERYGGDRCFVPNETKSSLRSGPEEED